MAQKGITAFLQAPTKIRASSSGAGVIRAAALSSPEAKLLGSTTPDAKLTDLSNAESFAKHSAVGMSFLERPSGLHMKQSLLSTAPDLAPSLAKRARTAGAVNSNETGVSAQEEEPAFDQINAGATTSGRPPLSPKYRKKVRPFVEEEQPQSQVNTEPVEAEAEAEQVQKNATNAPAEGTEGVLTEEQRLRIEVNKAAAMARLAQRRAEEIVGAAHAQGLLMPKLADLFLDQSWLEALPGELQKAYFVNLEKFVGQEVLGRLPVYPPQASIFRAFNTCPFDKVKVVILGQDPYHGPGQAMGLSFSVPSGVRIPPSLQNIFKELQDDLGCTIPQSGDLQKWASQGVLLLNTVLTVRQGQANSHSKRGWEIFTDAAIRTLSKQREGLVFLLWGRPAQEKLRLIDASSHQILKCAHPSGLSAHRGFFGCKHFSQTNKILHDAGALPIDWQL